MNIFLVALALIFLNSCAAVWNAPYKVEFASSSSITINYDPMLTNMGEIQKVAQENCDKYNKDAIPQAESTSPWSLKTMSFACNKRV